MQWRGIDALLEDDYAGRAVAQLAERLRKEPDNWRAATYAISILEQRSFAMPLGAVQAQPVWDLVTGKRLFTPAGGQTSDAAIDDIAGRHSPGRKGPRLYSLMP